MPPAHGRVCGRKEDIMGKHSLFTATTPEEAKEIFRKLKQEYGESCEIQFGILERVASGTVECLIFVNCSKIQFHGSQEAFTQLQDLVVREKMKKCN
jgi:hypothetical protein